VHPYISKTLLKIVVILVLLALVRRLLASDDVPCDAV
jgi:hypothetical protein